MQVRRVLERDKRSEEEAWNIINSQMSLDEKREKSDFVIENDGNMDDLNKKVDKFLKSLEQQ
jgi:dephospho-coA kinase